MPPNLRWGILGTGNIARQFAAGLATARRSIAAAVGSRTQASAQQFAQTFKIERIHSTYESLLADPKVDAIYNSLPNSLHCEWTLAALRAGKHVLCEKPLAMNADQAAQMCDAARGSDRVLMEAFMYRCHPLTAAVMQSVKGGAIGQLRMIRSSFCYHTRKVEENVRFERGLGGGALMDIGCYCINFARHFAAAPVVSVHAAAKMHPAGVDELTGGTLAFKNSIVSTFICGMNVQADNTAYLCGSEGFIEIPIPWKPPAQGAQFIITRGTPPRMDKTPIVPGPPPRDVRSVNAGGELYAIEADHFAAVVAGEIPPAVTHEDSIGNMQTLDEIRRQIGLHW